MLLNVIMAPVGGQETVSHIAFEHTVVDIQN